MKKKKNNNNNKLNKHSKYLRKTLYVTYTANKSTIITNIEF